MTTRSDDKGRLFQQQTYETRGHYSHHRPLTLTAWSLRNMPRSASNTILRKPVRMEWLSTVSPPKT